VVQVDQQPVISKPVAVAVASMPEAPPVPKEPIEPPPPSSEEPQELPTPAEPVVADAPPPKHARAAKRRHRASGGGRTAVNVARGFSRASDRARTCMGEGSPSRIMVRATLAASGEVLHVDVIDTRDAALAKCIREAVESKARFAPSTQPLEIRSWTFAG
jgi:hypothetical protein